MGRAKAGKSAHRPIGLIFSVAIMGNQRQDTRMSPSEPAAATFRRDVYTPSRLNEEVRQLLEGALPLLWIEGELANLARPRSGHLYFSLRDQGAQIRCAMFRNRNLHVRFQPRDGQHVLLRARVSLYAPRGDYQLIVEHMEEAGDGALRRAFEALKARLDAEGLFDAARKRPLPCPPRRLGVITSPTGAALRDVLQVLRRRFPALPVLVYPVPVQGAGAAEQIAGAIRLAGQRAEVDALLVTRGGGSLEDLWAFNEEAVARAIAASPIPVISAVGHEIDFTIADFVADQRAPTPSAGAELLSPDGAARARQFADLAARLRHGQRRGLALRRERVEALRRRLAAQHPGRRLQQRAQRLDELEQRLLAAFRSQQQRRGLRLEVAADRLRRSDPRQRVRQLRDRVIDQDRRLREAMQARLRRTGERFRALAHGLEAVSPLATVARGYAIVSRESDGEVLRDAAAAPVGTLVRAQLGRGELLCRVEKQNKNDDKKSRKN
jgi:exodeoxyribonuclease VII large subunit